ncbi:acylneuraminate cytidylyltransferase [Methanosarcina sp. 2.H.T.1A.6]|uniref:acylneuraminate cytidylyltransferase family protein n=1 Tax=unclassified Methanosarcina TaxID=2644672 RepID=UPI0006217A60|nr:MULTISPECIES: acylneuraminate cytidylyltransferase family protein [unclassified Methanosarcina]KKG09820.1 acylneuraminate cytidylyltransferase [Methanosarcina sp. 2.H.T.1A.15]KKG14910.1 acylneuraminate cytidylyltransferase [Methanosarcina sp. 2.H.T.1A.3]KKG21036.1 acylneuraminate cytidylyltransferase [Methanosarcina sp. 2.H.T.1A.6]KKG27285.1 acylneuraminate cytidylyltransferase [Methanosarcina sp. 2.H.T.1A.8]
MKYKIVALVPMRHNSERVPGKNYRSFAGKPLYHRIINSLSTCPEISQIVVDTDSPVIIEGLSRDFSDVKVIERPERLRAGTVPMNDVLLHDIQSVEADYYLQTHTTNPLLTAETISRAINLFLHNNNIYDSLFSVTRTQTRYWDLLTRPINHNSAILLRTQDLPPIFEENSCLYLFSRQTLESKHNRIGERPLMFEMDRFEAIDIDEELDFRIAELLYLESENNS